MQLLRPYNVGIAEMRSRITPSPCHLAASVWYTAPRHNSNCMLGAPVPSKIRPDDWDRLFAPNAPRRGGPLRALITILVPVAVIALLGVGTVYGLNYRQERFARESATAAAYAPTGAAIRTAT